MPRPKNDRRPRLCALCERLETMRGGSEQAGDADIHNGCGELLRCDDIHGLVCYECEADISRGDCHCHRP